MAEGPAGPDESLLLERLYVEGWALALTFATEEELRAGSYSVGIACLIVSILVHSVVIKWRPIRAFMGPSFARSASACVHNFPVWIGTAAIFLLPVTVTPYLEQRRWPLAWLIQTVAVPPPKPPPVSERPARTDASASTANPAATAQAAEPPAPAHVISKPMQLTLRFLRLESHQKRNHRAYIGLGGIPLRLECLALAIQTVLSAAVLCWEKNASTPR